MILCFRFDAILFFVFFSPSSIAITSLGEERANLSAFRKFVRFVLVWICWFSFPLGVWEELRFVILELSGLFYYLFFYSTDRSKAMVPVLVLLFVALWFILRCDLFYVLPCVILFLCFSVLLALRLPSLGKRES